MTMNPFRKSVQTHRAWSCLDCGKCSSVCPITLYLAEGYTSPRLLVEKALSAGEASVLDDSLLWSCLTCGRCSQICPSGVEFSGFIRDSRQLARQQGRSGECTHSGVIQTWGRLMTDPERVQDRLGWIDGELRTATQSDTIYWPGCLPYYQECFQDLGIEGIEVARAAVKILNLLGIEPLILADERCCGHDQYWQGDQDTFRELADLNLDMIKASGAKRIITTCPECAYTLKHLYPAEVGSHQLEVLHLVELLPQLAEILPRGECSQHPNVSVTYQDPCRLGRFAAIYQQPRDLIHLAGYSLVEMEHSRGSSLCCGTSCWASCGQANLRIQSERLAEARNSGADMLITSCIKCQIHLKCAQKGSPERSDRIMIRDLATVLAEVIV